MVRNAVDLVAYTCGHYLRVGFDRLTFLDDGSTDGTFELLQRISAKTERVSVVAVARFRNEQENQPRLITSAVNELISDGVEIVVPFDADEFWNVTAPFMRGVAASFPEGLFVGHWLNFVQDRRVRHPHPLSLLRVRYRCPAMPSASRDSLSAYEVPFVAHPAVKVGVKSRQPVQVARGQHGLLEGPTNVICNLEVFHVPLRAESEITRRAHDYAPRILPRRSNQRESWQLDFFRREVEGGLLAQAWAAHSADRNGAISLGERSFPLLRDDRFRQLLIKAAYFLARRYRLTRVLF